MALTAQERHSVIYFLGWPSKTLDVNSTHYSKIVSDRIDTISTEGEVEVRDLLCRIKTIREQINDAQCRAATAKVDNIVLQEEELRKLWALERKWLCILSELTDIPVMRKNSMCGNLVV